MPSSNGIVEHTVLFKVKEEATPSQIDDMLSSISSLKTDPSVLHLSIGPVRSVRQCTYSPPKHQSSSSSSSSSSGYFTHMMHSRHTNKADVLVYYEDPVHMSIKDKVVPILDDFMAFDWVVQQEGLDGPATLPAGTAVKLQLLKLKVGEAEEERRVDDRVLSSGDEQVVEKEMAKEGEEEKVVVAAAAPPLPQLKKEEKEVVDDEGKEEYNEKKCHETVMEIEVEGVQVQAKVVDVKANNNNNTTYHTVMQGQDEGQQQAPDLSAKPKAVVEAVEVIIKDQTTTITTQPPPPPPPPPSATDKVMEVISGIKGKVSGLKHLNYGENFMPELAKDFSVCLVGIFNGVEEMDKVEAIVNVDDDGTIDSVDGSIVVDYVVVFHEPAAAHH